MKMLLNPRSHRISVSITQLCPEDGRGLSTEIDRKRLPSRFPGWFQWVDATLSWNPAGIEDEEVKSLARVRPAATLPWLGFDRCRGRRDVSPAERRWNQRAGWCCIDRLSWQRSSGIEAATGLGCHGSHHSLVRSYPRLRSTPPGGRPTQKQTFRLVFASFLQPSGRYGSGACFGHTTLEAQQTVFNDGGKG